METERTPASSRQVVYTSRKETLQIRGGGGAMFHVVRFFRGREVVATFEFGGLVEAKTCAKIWLPIERIREGATDSEVADIEGVICFRFGP
jgi:hypothetical protein